jgi:RNA polymerase sigma factor for flagellar operon FliA
MTTREALNRQKAWRDYKATGDPSLRNLLIESYMPIVRYHAERIHVKLPRDVELDDLVAEGVFGLIDAVDAFDLDRGVKFETYCESAHPRSDH